MSHASLLNGQYQIAFTFYDRCLGGEMVTMLTWGSSPLAEQAPPGWSDKILNATMTIGSSALMGVDSPDAESHKGFFVTLAVDTPEEAERVFHALAENGKTQMPLRTRSGHLPLVCWLINLAYSEAKKCSGRQW
jgi:PhnB protein